MQEVDLTSKNRLRKLRETKSETVVKGEEYQRRLREQFARVNQSASWAQLPSSTTSAIGGLDDDEDEDAGLESKDAKATASRILSTSAALSYEGSGKRMTAAAGLAALPKGLVDVSRVADANKSAPSYSIVSMGRFHPNGELFMTAGLDKTIRLFQIDCVKNPKVQSVLFEDMPVHCAAFLGPEGTEIIASGRRKHFYVYDLVHGAVTKVPGIQGRNEKSFEQFCVSPDGALIAMLGTDGYIILLQGKSKQWIANLKASTKFNSVTFTADSKRLLSVGRDGCVYTWDVASRKCIGRHADEGTVHGTVVATSWDGAYYATGSDSGVVNVYAQESLLGTDVKPLKTMLNLTTSIDNLTFSKSNELLAMSSRSMKDQMRLVHLPSLTVFSNWPTSSTPFSYIQDMDFSPHSGLLAVSNDKGRVISYRLNHYQTI